VDGRWIHGNTITLSNKMLLSIGSLERRVLLHVTNHEHTAGQTTGLLNNAICKTNSKTSQGRVIKESWKSHERVTKNHERIMKESGKSHGRARGESGKRHERVMKVMEESGKSQGRVREES